VAEISSPRNADACLAAILVIIAIIFGVIGVLKRRAAGFLIESWLLGPGLDPRLGIGGAATLCAATGVAALINCARRRDAR
jgi:hypothetical protein